MASFLDPASALAALGGAWRWTVRAQQAWACAAMDPPSIERLRLRRLSALLEHAWCYSPYYRALYGPRGACALERLPTVSKQALMARFDDWVVDARLRRADIERFVADPARIGDAYLGQYTVWTSSGSTGRPGVFVQDPDALAVYDALLATRFPSARAVPSLFSLLAAGGRFAMIAAIGGHFAGVVSWERLRRAAPWMAASTRAFSVLAPLPRLVHQLNDYSPTVLASYPTTLLLLARERAAGRLRVRPRALWSGGETLAAAERAEIASAFEAPVVDGYGASECLQIAYDCGCGSLHLNSDWVILEAVDEHGRAVPAGTRSATSLLTNLANRVQPLIRYDLGDSITYRTGPCACGSPFPAIEVDGRRDDIVVLDDTAGVPVSLPPLAVATVLEEDCGLGRFQVIQSGPRALRVRFETPEGVLRAQAWHRILAGLRAYLARQGLNGVTVREDPAPPRPDPVSGKLREVIGLRAAKPHEPREKETRHDASIH